MKTIKDCKCVRTRTFIFVLLLMFLLSSTVGTIIAEKPAKPPGKPDNPGKTVETWDLQIYIGMKDSEGNPTENIVLMEPDYLSAEDVPCSGGLWNFPEETKGKSTRGKYVNVQVSLYKIFNETTGEWIGDDCGTYALEHVQGENSYGAETWLDEFNHTNPDYHIVEVDIGHQVDPLGQDYWWFHLIWTTKQTDPNNYEAYYLRAWTNKDSEPEVEPEGNVLTVVFEEIEPNQSNAMIFSRWDDENLDGVPDEYHWMGTLSFTIVITRELHAT